MQRYKNWKIIASNTPKTLEEVENTLLENRKIFESNEKKEFLKPSNPEIYKLKDLNIDEKQVKKALERISAARKNKEKIIVYGDYDVDGVCSTAIVWETLYKLKLNVSPYIPNRFSDGYGIRKKSLEKLLIQNPDLKLIITVDNGIVAHEAINFANKKGIDVIVLDHHEKDNKKNKSLAIIHSTKICGAAVAYFFSLSLLKKFKINSSNLLELATLGTISDQMPLIGINRSIVWYGLKEISKTKRIGLKKLIEISSIDKSITTYDINFKIAPRINAAGRVDEGLKALQLLCTKDEARASKLAEELNNLNLKRQEIVERTIELAKGKVEEENKIILVWGEGLHEGVIGLAASKLVEKYYRPSIVLSVDGDIAKASARSINGFNIISAIRELEELIIEGGGHEMAAGFSIYKKSLEEFNLRINDLNKNKLTDELLTPYLKVDTKINFNLLNREFYKLLEKFSPKGIGNPEPVFVSTGVRVKDFKKVGADGKHLKIIFSQNGVEIDTIAFNMGYLAEALMKDLVIDIAYNVDLNIWNGRESIQLKLKDVRESYE